MNYLKFLPEDWQSAALIIVLIQSGMFFFLNRGQTHIKELLSLQEKRLDKLETKIDRLLEAKKS